MSYQEDNIRRARKAFKRAMKLKAKGEHAKACRAFSRATESLLIADFCGTSAFIDDARATVQGEHFDSIRKDAKE